MHRKKVTYARADRVVLAIAALIECDDFAEAARAAGVADATGLFDRAADAARAMRIGSGRDGTAGETGGGEARGLRD